MVATYEEFDHFQGIPKHGEVHTPNDPIQPFQKVIYFVRERIKSKLIKWHIYFEKVSVKEKNIYF